MNYWLIKVTTDDFDNIFNKREDKYIVFNNKSQIGDIVIIYRDKQISGIYQISQINKLSNVRYELYFSNDYYKDYSLKDMVIKIKPQINISVQSFNGKYLKNEMNNLILLDDKLGKAISELCYNYIPEIPTKLNVIEEVTEESSEFSKTTKNNIANKKKYIKKKKNSI